MSTIKLKAPSGGSVSLVAEDTASDVVFTIPATPGSIVTTADLAAPTGSSLVGFDATLNYAVGTIGAVIKGWGANVQAFPWLAKGDGVTDDTASIQAALTSAGSVYLPGVDDCYLISDTLKYRTGQQIYGDGDRSQIKMAAGSVKNMFYPVGPFGSSGAPNAYSVDDVIFDGLCLDHNITSAGDFVESIMTLVALSTKHLRVINVHFKNPSGDCVYIGRKYGVDESTVIPYDLQFTGCRFSGDNINRNGISVITGNNIGIHKNHFYQITKAGMPGPIDLEPNNTTETIFNVSITGNTFDGCKGGISTYITGTTYADYGSIRNISVTDNNFYNQFAVSPYVARTQSTIAIYNATNVTVHGNNLYGSEDIGIDLAKSMGVNCSGNNLYGTKLVGIRIKDIQSSKVDDNMIVMPNDTAGGVACIGIEVDTLAVLVGSNFAFVGGSIANNTLISTAVAPTNNCALQMQGNASNLKISGIASGFKTGLYLGNRVSAGPTLNKYDLDVSQNVTPYASSWSSFSPRSLMGFNLGENVTQGVSSFSAGTSKVITGLPTRLTSVVRATRIGAAGIANTLAASVATAGQLTITSSASESGSFVWEILQF